MKKKVEPKTWKEIHIDFELRGARGGFNGMFSIIVPFDPKKMSNYTEGSKLIKEIQSLGVMDRRALDLSVGQILPTFQLSEETDSDQKPLSPNQYRLEGSWNNKSRPVYKRTSVVETQYQNCVITYTDLFTN